MRGSVTMGVSAGVQMVSAWLVNDGGDCGCSDGECVAR